MSEQIKRVRIDKVNISEPKTSKNGKQYFSAGIAIGDTWHNAMLWDEKACDKLRDLETKETSIVFYEEEYNGKYYKKFKLPSQMMIKVMELEMRVSQLEERFDKAAAMIRDMGGTPPADPVSINPEFDDDPLKTAHGAPEEESNKMPDESHIPDPDGAWEGSEPPF